MIIDSHIHISYLGKKEKSFSNVKADLFDSMKKNGIDYAIAIPDNVPNPQCADMENLKEVMKGEKQLFSLGTVNIFDDIDSQIQELDGLLKKKEIHGIKLFPGHDPFYPIDERCRSVYGLCIKYGLPVVVHTGINSEDTNCAKYNDPKYLVEVAQKYKELKIVISHFFWPKMEYCYEITKDFENIHYDTSAMADPEVVEASGGWDSVVQVLKKVVIEKPDNVIFGTDWPMCPVDKHIELVKALNLKQEIEENIFSQNAIDLYKLDI